MKFAWIDLRTVPHEQREAIIDAAIHARIDGVFDDTPDVLTTLPPTIRRVLLSTDGTEPDPGQADLVVRAVNDAAGIDRIRGTGGAALVEVVDEPTLRLACTSGTVLPCTIVKFRDPTKIPLEIVIAAADHSDGELVCEVSSIEEAAIVLDVLEKGSEGLLMAPQGPSDVFRLAELLHGKTPELELTTLIVDSIEHNGLGDRVCVDTCTHFRQDEGILVGSYAHGFVLCVSETHPLPYMPTRPFRVNAGALHSYVLGPDNRTNYLSELTAGSTVLAVSATGQTRPVTVGRVKLESRPLLTIKATSGDGVHVSLTVQDDWHVRVLGPGTSVLNVTELRPGSKLLGYVSTDQRHVGWPVGEFCIEK
ncbi:3-dehydroquinate synthase II family protein [Salinispora pacifica]|uniref:3-dehydroquinate synthase II family protein n=1 Tax=Salinispora pacifica TaxID=351187 RepID=UPI00035DA5F4|nr:3-dehydroquinate synthase II [Salinispora pacifica]